MVGAVVVRNGGVVGEDYHHRFGESHAEVGALAAAGPRAAGATLYVTLEPCAHHGKTPPCVDAIVAAGVSRVVAAVADPSPEARGGLERLRAAGIDVALGVCEDEARELNAPFFHAFRARRPWTTLKLALSLDGAIADHTRAPGSITGNAAWQMVHRLRAGSDAVAVGMGTVLTDDPQLTVRLAPAPRIPPVRVVFSRGGRLPLTSRLAQSVHEAPVLVLAETVDSSYEHLLHALGVDVLCAATLADAMEMLASRGIRALLVEGGARLGAMLLRQELIDRLVVFQAPVILGAGALNAFAELPSARIDEARRLRVVRRETVGEDVMTVYDVEAA
jgi:diaminohydroxyphosphoribosylaminopyrimidine deaminase/5-amino-6-(5-phosphoribosylamino)uracil reductase